MEMREQTLQRLAGWESEQLQELEEWAEDLVLCRAEYFFDRE